MGSVHQASSDVQMDSASWLPCDVMVCPHAQMEVMNSPAVSFHYMLSHFHINYVIQDSVKDI